MLNLPFFNSFNNYIFYFFISDWCTLFSCGLYTSTRTEPAHLLQSEMPLRPVSQMYCWNTLGNLCKQKISGCNARNYSGTSYLEPGTSLPCTYALHCFWWRSYQGWKNPKIWTKVCPTSMLQQPWADQKTITAASHIGSWQETLPCSGSLYFTAACWRDQKVPLIQSHGQRIKICILQHD